MVIPHTASDAKCGFPFYNTSLPSSGCPTILLSSDSNYRASTNPGVQGLCRVPWWSLSTDASYKWVPPGNPQLCLASYIYERSYGQTWLTQRTKITIHSYLLCTVKDMLWEQPNKRYTRQGMEVYWAQDFDDLWVCLHLCTAVAPPTWKLSGPCTKVFIF